MNEEIAEIERTVLHAQAHAFALESLCLALFELSENKEHVIERFRYYKLSLTDDLLYSADMKDEAFLAFDSAHAKIEGLLLNVHAETLIHAKLDQSGSS